MKKRTAGLLVIGIALLIGVIIFSFNRALTDIVGTACSHGSSCPMWGTIEFQTNVSLGIMIFVIVIGLYLVFFTKEEQIVQHQLKHQVKQKKITKEGYKDILGKLVNDEKNVFEKIIESEGTIFQSELVDKTGLTKVKITRVLDKLEGRGLIERKRRGMTNVVILKH